MPNSLIIKRIKEVEGTPITQAFIGSCTSGRYSDIEFISNIMSQYKLNDLTKLIIIPSSISIYKKAIETKLIPALLTKGVALCNPSCGPCCNIDKGLIGDKEVCISTSNRNFLGRMGSLKSEVYLASIYTVAYSAISGKIVNPQKFM